MAFEEKNDVVENTSDIENELKVQKEENERLKSLINEQENKKTTIEDYKAQREQLILQQKEEQIRQQELEKFGKALKFVDDYKTDRYDDATQTILKSIKGNSKLNAVGKENIIKKVCLQYFFDKNINMVKEIAPAHESMIQSFLNSSDVDEQTVKDLWSVQTNMLAYIEKEENRINQERFAKGGHYTDDNMIKEWSSGKNCIV